MFTPPALNSMEFMSCSMAKPIASPIAVPVPTSARPLPITRRSTSERAAPRAMRMPISQVLRLTLYATSPYKISPLFPLFQTVHRAHRGVARLFRGKPIGDAFLDFVRQVKLQLLIELRLHPAATQNGPQPQGCREPPVFNPHDSF